MTYKQRQKKTLNDVEQENNTSNTNGFDTEGYASITTLDSCYA